MKKTLFAVSILLLSARLYAQQVVIVPLQGEEFVCALSSIGRMTLSSDTLSLYDKSGTLIASEYVFDLQKIMFSGTTGLPSQDTSSLFVGVSPDGTSLLINGLSTDTDTDLRIFSLSGQLFYSVKEHGPTITIPIVSLPQGTYLLLVGVQPVKFIKY